MTTSKLPRAVTAPASPLERASKGASNDEFTAPAVATAGPAARAWDPFEVWRTRVFQTPGKRYNKDRGNT